MKDPFEAAVEEQDSPPESPIPPDDEIAVPAEGEEDEADARELPEAPSSAPPPATAGPGGGGRGKEEEEEEEEENMGVELGKLPSSGDPDKMARMQSILAQFTEDQMSRYESFRRSGFQKSNMKRLLASIVGSQKISVPMTIVVSGIAKMFVGELIETARIVMTERGDMGPIRPCHIREAYRRLRLEGKIPKRSVPRLFR
ncbi:putative transcription factor Hap3/NF-YB family [Dioscorea sansibarensis]